MKIYVHYEPPPSPHEACSLSEYTYIFKTDTVHPSKLQISSLVKSFLAAHDGKFGASGLAASSFKLFLDDDIKAKPLENLTGVADGADLFVIFDAAAAAAAKKTPAPAPTPTNKQIDPSCVANKYYEKKSYKKAAIICQEFLVVNPDHLPSLRILGMINMANSKHSKALALFERVVTLSKPDKPAEFVDDHVWFGKACIEEEDYDRALDLFEKATEVLKAGDQPKAAYSLNDCVVLIGEALRAAKNEPHDWTSNSSLRLLQPSVTSPLASLPRVRRSPR